MNDNFLPWPHERGHGLKIEFRQREKCRPNDSLASVLIRLTDIDEYTVSIAEPLMSHLW